MRKLLTLIIAPFFLITGLQAQLLQVQADEIVLEKMSVETRPYSIYAKEDVQPAGTVLTTSAGETMVFEYNHWIYYVSFTDNIQNNYYFVVKENNGSLLEVNVKNDDGPNNIETWVAITDEIENCDCEDEIDNFYLQMKGFIFDWLFVYFSPQIEDNVIANYLNETGFFKFVDSTNFFYTSKNTCNEEYRMLFVELKRPKNCSKLKQIISILEENPMISYTNFTFWYMTPIWDGPYICGLANCIYVVVRNLNSLTDLYAFAQETNTEVLCSLAPEYPETFEVKITQNSSGNTLQIAKYFKNSGKFYDVIPGWNHTLIEYGESFKK